MELIEKYLGFGSVVIANESSTRVHRQLRIQLHRPSMEYLGALVVDIALSPLRSVPTMSPSDHSTVLTAFPPYQDKQELPDHQRTCIRISRGVLTQRMDTFSENDAFVKVVPDLDTNQV